MDHKQTDIAVVGAGAMGALFGAILAENGLDVVLIDADQEHIDTINSGGLQIEGYGGNRSIRIPGISDPQELESANLLLFQCKAHGTCKAAKSVRHLLHENSVCISFQNGLGNEEMLGEELGTEKVLGGLTAMAGKLLGPGRVQDFSRVPSYIGEMQGGSSDRVSSISKKLTQSGLETRPSENIRIEIWKKLLGNISMSAISGLTNLSSAEANRVPELKSVSIQAMEEALKVAQAHGIGLNREAVMKGMETISQPGGTGDNKSSLCMDLLNRRPTEVDFIYGNVIKLGKEKKISTPTLKTLHSLVKGVESGFKGDFS